MVVQGQDTTLPVTLDQIIYHSQMVARGSQRALLVGDMPFMTYQVSVEDALRNSARLITEGKVGAVKIEGGVSIAPTIERLVSVGVPVCGHLGFTPQSVHAMGGPRIQGKDPSAAASLVADAQGTRGCGCICNRAGVGARLGCSGDFAASVDPDHRHRRRTVLRWRDPGFSRPVRPLHRLQAASTPAAT